MGYDTDVHIPGQVDFLLLSFDNKNLDGISQSLDILLELVKDDGFKSDVKGYESDYKLRVKEVEKDFVKKLNVLKSMDEAVRLVNDYHNEVNEVYNSYLGIIRNYVIGYFKKIE